MRREATGHFAIIGWHIWIGRNNWVFKYDWKMEIQIIEEAVEDFNLIGILSGNITWKPSDLGILKMRHGKGVWAWLSGIMKGGFWALHVGGCFNLEPLEPFLLAVESWSDDV
ncbi:hypothetical protein RHMOL_Rhmol05G0135100 [Rhododendron molle]|uniref:Uncharacterized protein n=1 Tax=Rhododendron molle TaxID=49168 RepID=A0ACC0NQA6_RHOML|nr:hypothetical protein RHMOL_Rhmol05G0135100 [Rhododendron molle]